MTTLDPLNSAKFFCPDCGITEAGKCPCKYTVEPSIEEMRTRPRGAEDTDLWVLAPCVLGIGVLVLLAG